MPISPKVIYKINASPIKLLKSRTEDPAILTFTSCCQSAPYGATQLSALTSRQSVPTAPVL